MKFIADCMLGTLSKWLLILGHDVVYLSRVEDGELVDLTDDDPDEAPADGSAAE